MTLADPAPPPALSVSASTADGAAPTPRARWLLLVPILALVLVAGFVPIPYFVLSPGPARDVLPLVHVEGHKTYPTTGRLLLTSVYQSATRVTAFEALRAWRDPTEAVVPERDILAPGETPQQEVTRSLSDMDTSKIDAAVVALTHYAGYPARHGKGVLVESVFPGTPAAGKLYPGDVIEAVNDAPIDSPERLGRLIRSAGVGRSLTFLVRAAGESHVFHIAPARVPDVRYPVIGISSVPNFPFRVDISSGDIGGPSAGLMWTVGLIDLLTPGDLVRDRVIAGTGTIAPDGRVGPIGGIEEKVVGAERAGATIFFAPAAEAAAARSLAHGVTVVPVKTYLDAVRYLQRAP